MQGYLDTAFPDLTNPITDIRKLQTDSTDDASSPTDACKLELTM